MGTFDFLSTMNGPDFLALYFFWLVITRAGVTIMRRQGLDHPWVTLGGVLLYEGLGALRIWVGSASGLGSDPAFTFAKQRAGRGSDP